MKEWHSIRDGLEAKFAMVPKSDDDELQRAAPEPFEMPKQRFIQCRSRDRSKREEAITQRFEFTMATYPCDQSGIKK